VTVTVVNESLDPVTYGAGLVRRATSFLRPARKKIAADLIPLYLEELVGDTKSKAEVAQAVLLLTAFGDAVLAAAESELRLRLTAEVSRTLIPRLTKETASA
jgi:hypothetical protein